MERAERVRAEYETRLQALSRELADARQQSPTPAATPSVTATGPARPAQRRNEVSKTAVVKAFYSGAFATR